MARMSQTVAAGCLRALGFDPKSPPDFHSLDSGKVEALLMLADERKYRKPKNANGSRARSFYGYVTRTAKSWSV